ncbi:PREDICTED: uncharacterized protein LOC109582049 [Amphimedon queenslandica]|uniref:FAM234A/B beta-propeller domain-containing protein n=1 Tax=Amphimedon queenslandica TaxID=400682 RepID=A0A1X7VTV0_AMPQE|nr:PREDICTED: uncharacterized protein LOC109582049 [Amphimedon queenslandica]|eukprot:XP_019852173.1 PREDICTED: uncharacterized protein LOC109582049 [Amphimedon queenslandica]
MSARYSYAYKKGKSYHPLSQRESDEEKPRQDMDICSNKRMPTGKEEMEDHELVFIVTDNDIESKGYGKRSRSISLKTLLLIIALAIIFCIIVTCIVLSLLDSFTPQPSLMQTSSSTQNTQQHITSSLSSLALPLAIVSQSASRPLTIVHSVQPSPTLLPFRDWTYEVSGITELSVHVSDIDSDGSPDVIFDAITDSYNFYQTCPNSSPEDDMCFIKQGHTPCQVQLLGLGGYSGTLVWNHWSSFAPFAANCREDLNKDGHNDCLFSGRIGTFVAIDVHRNILLWSVDINVTCPSFNYYYPLYVPDLDRDGIMDIIVVHGGDSNYSPLATVRSPGVIVVISGGTGRQISDRIHTPDQKESYSSPVLYSVPPSSSSSSSSVDLILFGTGGETITGSLWAISLNSLSAHVSSFMQRKEYRMRDFIINKDYFHPSCYNSSQLLSSRPRIREGLYDNDKKEVWLESCPKWSASIKPVWNVYKLCVYELYRSVEVGGVMLPPVIADINNDDKNDLIVSAFNGHTLLFDGHTLSFKWDHYVPGTQSYSIPAPIYFNDDDVLDIILRINKGSWSKYDYSLLAVLDGRGGEGGRRVGGERGMSEGSSNYLWMLNCSQSLMSSPVVWRHRDKGHDGFLFAAVDCSTGHKERAKKDTLNVCPAVRQQMDSWKINERTKRHEDEEDEEMENEEGNNDGVSPPDAVPEPFEFFGMTLNLSSYIPTDLWEVHNASDSYPDPESDTESFISSYCGMDYQSMRTGVYFLTSKLIKEEKEIKPLLMFKPYVYRTQSPNAKTKRHSFKPPSVSDIIEDTKNRLSNRKVVRCSHVLAPHYSPSTLAITDVNGDSSPEGIVSMQYSAVSGALDIPQLSGPLHSPKITVQAFNIEDKVMEVYGAGAAAGINFKRYYASEDQPWGQYMGSHGNSLYNNPQNK